MSEAVGAVKALWRFPVKSMRGEQVEAADVTESGLVGDRAYALIDPETGKVMSGKNPRLGSNLLGCRAAFVEAPPGGRRASARAHHIADRRFGQERRPRCRRHPLGLLGTPREAGAGRARGLHDRPVPPRHRGLGPRRTSRHRHRVEAGVGVLRPSGSSIGGPRGCVLRSLPGVRPDDLHPRPVERTPPPRASSTNVVFA
jgi:MOSC N-terminal beta barrel domain